MPICSSSNVAVVIAATTEINNYTNTRLSLLYPYDILIPVLHPQPSVKKKKKKKTKKNQKKPIVHSNSPGANKLFFVKLTVRFTIYNYKIYFYYYLFLSPASFFIYIPSIDDTNIILNIITFTFRS
jgi:hypothetical protein